MKIITITTEEFGQLQQQIAEISKSIEDQRKKNIVYDGPGLMDMLNISVRTLNTWREDGTIRYVKIGRKIYYRTQDVEEMLERGLIDNLNPSK